MECYRKNNVSHSSFGEVMIFVLAIILILVFGLPKALSIYNNIRLNSAIDSVNSYRESVDNYYMSQMINSNDFKFNGTYYIDNGNLIMNSDVYDIGFYGNKPSSGFLTYENNVLKSGCVSVGGYSVYLENGSVSSTSRDGCSYNITVAYGI